MDVGMAAQDKRDVGALGTGLQDFERLNSGPRVKTGAVHVFDAQLVRLVFVLTAIGGKNDVHDRAGAQLRDLLGSAFADSVQSDRADQIIPERRLEFLDRMPRGAMSD